MSRLAQILPHVTAGAAPAVHLPSTDTCPPVGAAHSAVGGSEWGDCLFDVPAETTVYLTGVSTPLTRSAAAGQPLLGLLTTPASGLHRQIGHYRLWAADNGCFTQGDRFDLERHLTWLDGLPRDGCLFATAPDTVCDARATWERSAPALPRIRRLGFPAALVAQNGMEDLEVDWTAFDALFIGGDTDWKLSRTAADLAAEARARGLWTHMGRVNSYKRLKVAAAFGYDSVDGTYLGFGPRVNGPKLLDWLDRLSAETFEAHQEHRFTAEPHTFRHP